MTAPRWLPALFLHTAHAQLIRDHGGRPGLRDSVELQECLQRPIDKHRRGIAEPFALAAGYGHALARRRPFHDANDRLALMALCGFLQLNGYELDSSEPEAVHVLRRLTEGDMLEGELAEWLADRCRPIPS